MGGFIHNFRMLDLRDGCGLLETRKKNLSAGEEVGQRARTISSGERIPNWTSFTLRMGAEEYANW
jgi:hypothetical protein